MQQLNLLRRVHARVLYAIQKLCDALLLRDDAARSTPAFALSWASVAGYPLMPPCSYRSYLAAEYSCTNYWERLQALHRAWVRSQRAYRIYLIRHANQKYLLLFSHSPTQLYARVSSFCLLDTATHQRWWPDGHPCRYLQSESWRAWQHDHDQFYTPREPLERRK